MQTDRSAVIETARSRRTPEGLNALIVSEIALPGV